jgi:hypothetical protein
VESHLLGEGTKVMALYHLSDGNKKYLYASSVSVSNDEIAIRGNKNILVLMDGVQTQKTLRKVACCI